MDAIWSWMLENWSTLVFVFLGINCVSILLRIEQRLAIIGSEAKEIRTEVQCLAHDFSKQFPDASLIAPDFFADKEKRKRSVSG